MLRASGLFPPPLWGREFCFSLPPVGEGVLFFPPPCGGGSFVFPSPLWGREFCFSLPLVGEGVLFFPPPLWGREFCFSLPPCGGGLGWGVELLVCIVLPPTPALPPKGGGSFVR